MRRGLDERVSSQGTRGGLNNIKHASVRRMRMLHDIHVYTRTCGVLYSTTFFRVNGESVLRRDLVESQRASGVLNSTHPVSI